MNFTLERWDQTIGGLYDAVLQPDLLAAALVTANRAMDSDFCHLLGVTPQGQVSLNIVTEPGYTTAIHDYSNHFVTIDPRRQFVDSQAVGTTYRCSSLFTPTFVDRNEFYQDFLKPHGLRYIIGSCLHRSNKLSVYAAFNHVDGRSEFTDEEHKYFHLLNQHLARVITAIDRVRPISTALSIGEHALDTIRVGVMGVSAQGIVTYVNSEARAELKAFIFAGDGTGRLADGSICRLLVQQVLDDGMPHGARLPGHGSTMRVVTAFPAPRNAATGEKDVLDARHTAVVLVLSQPGQRSPRPSLLMEWFNLSPAEARLANALAAGGSVEHYADTYSISVATARTQLRAILKKTGTDRQQDFTRLIASLPAL